LTDASRPVQRLPVPKTQMLLAGHSMSEIIDSVETAFRKKELPGLVVRWNGSDSHVRAYCP
jgi:hypothetical protein